MERLLSYFMFILKPTWPTTARPLRFRIYITSGDNLPTISKLYLDVNDQETMYFDTQRENGHQMLFTSRPDP